MIAAVRLSYFAVSVFRRDYGLSRDAPLVIIRRGVVFASCALSAKHGIYPGMTRRQVEVILPEARVMQDEEERRRTALEGILNTLAQFTPLVEHDTDKRKRKTPRLTRGDGEQSALFLLDWERLIAAQALYLTEQVGKTIWTEHRITAALGLANSPFPAYAASVCAHPAEVVSVPHNGERDFLEPLPITLLRADEELHRRLRLLGITTLGQFAALPSHTILNQFGKSGYTLYGLAGGRDSRRIIPHTFSVVEHVTRQLDDPLGKRDMLEALIRAMAVELSARLQSKGAMGRTLTLKLHLENRQVRETTRTLKRAISGTAYLIGEALRLSARFKSLRYGVSSIELAVSDLVPFAGYQLELFSHRTGGRERLNAAIGDLVLRYDAEHFKRIAPINTDARRIEGRYTLHSVYDSAVD
jgi:DNA polymerase IV